VCIGVEAIAGKDRLIQQFIDSGPERKRNTLVVSASIIVCGVVAGGLVRQFTLAGLGEFIVFLSFAMWYFSSNLFVFSGLNSHEIDELRKEQVQAQIPLEKQARWSDSEIENYYRTELSWKPSPDWDHEVDGAEIGYEGFRSSSARELQCTKANNSMCLTDDNLIHAHDQKGMGAVATIMLGPASLAAFALGGLIWGVAKLFG